MKTKLNRKLTCIAMLTLFLSPLTVFAGEVIVLWKTPSKYFDIVDDKNNVEAKVKAKLQDLGSHFAKLSNELPENQTLNIQVHDIDLAGTIQVVGLNYVRVYSETNKPKMSFSYELVEDSKVISSDSLVISDANFSETTNRRHLKLDPLQYEKRMITKWFDKTFE